MQTLSETQTLKGSISKLHHIPAAKSVHIIFCARDPDWRLFNNISFYIEISFRDAKEGSLRLWVLCGVNILRLS